MKQDTHTANMNHLKSVIMNDFGMTRESIRTYMNGIAQEIAEKHIKSGAFDNIIRQQIDAEIQRQLGLNYRYGSTFKSVIAEAVAEAIKRDITKGLKFSVEGQYEAA